MGIVFYANNNMVKRVKHVIKISVYQIRFI